MSQLSVGTKWPLRLLRTFAAGAWLVLPAAPPALAAPGGPPGVSLRYAPQRGDARILRFRMEGETAWSLERLSALWGGMAAAPAKQSFALDGELHTRVLGVRDGRVRLAARLQRARFLVDGRETARSLVL